LGIDLAREALLELMFAPDASGAAQLDTVTVTGSSPRCVNININAQSGTSGQNATGIVTFGVPVLTPRGTIVIRSLGP
jgi:hypothetical protein